MLNDRCGREQMTVSRDRQNRDGAAAIVGEQDVPAFFIDGDVAGSYSTRVLLVEQAECAIGAVYRERAHGARALGPEIGDLAHREQMRVGRMDAQERRIR